MSDRWSRDPWRPSLDSSTAAGECLGTPGASACSGCQPLDPPGRPRRYAVARIRSRLGPGEAQTRARGSVVGYAARAPERREARPVGVEPSVQGSRTLATTDKDVTRPASAAGWEEKMDNVAVALVALAGGVAIGVVLGFLARSRWANQSIKVARRRPPGSSPTRAPSRRT